MLSFLYEDAVHSGFTVSVFCNDDVYAYLEPFLKERSMQRFRRLDQPLKSALMFFNHLRNYTLIDFAHNQTLDLYRREAFAASRFFLPYVIWPLARIIRLLPAGRRRTFWDAIEYRAFGRNSYYRGVFASSKFSYMVFPSAVLKSPDDLLLFACAKRAGVKVVSVDETFGQFDNHVVSFRDFDKMFIWSTGTLEKGKQLNHVNAQALRVVGPYRFDPYFKNQLPSREDFFSILGLDPSKKLITLMLGGEAVEHQIISAILRMQEEDAFNSATHLLISLNPFVSKEEEFVQYAGHAAVTVYDSRKSPSLAGFNALQSRLVEVGALLKYSSVLICRGSTLGVEAAVFDTPAIYYMFGISGAANEYDTFPFLAEVIRTGAVPVARSIEELSHAISHALRAPHAESKNRSLLVEKKFTYTDGRAGERIMVDLLTKTQ
jgi:hypothetical protein